MAFDPALVERHTCVVSPDGAVLVKVTRGFGDLPPLNIPIGCPPEFAEMIRAAAAGDTSLIERSYHAHPERRQRPESEMRSIAALRSSAVAEDDEDDDEEDDDDQIARIDGLSLEAATREFNEVIATDLPTSLKALRLKQRITNLTRSNPEPTHLQKRIAARSNGKKQLTKRAARSTDFDEQINMVRRELVAPVWAIEICKRAKERTEEEIAYRRLVLMNTIMDIGVADEIF